jgi:hypothetical protein
MSIYGLKICVYIIRGDRDASVNTTRSAADARVMVVVEDGDGAVEHHAKEACHTVPEGGVGVSKDDNGAAEHNRQDAAIP